MKPFALLLPLLMLLAGPAAAGQSPDQLIADAKTAMAKTDSMGYLWRDTGKILKAAEQALAKGDNDAAAKLATQALQQANDAQAQYARYYQSAGPRF
jgi:hypothetical protein